MVALSLTVVLVLVAGIGAWRGISAGPSVSGPESPIPTAEPARVRPATIETTVDPATSRAQKWDPNARLLAVTAQLDFPTDPTAGSGGPVGGWLIYVFVRGEGDDTEALTVRFERNRADIVRETARSLGHGALGLDPGAILAAAVDSAQALTIAEAEAGRDFRAGCLPTRHVARMTFLPGDGESAGTWLVSYNDSRVTNGPVLRIRVDAQTGQATASRLEATIPPAAEIRDCPA